MRANAEIQISKLIINIELMPLASLLIFVGLVVEHLEWPCKFKHSGSYQCWFLCFTSQKDVHMFL